MNLYFYLVENRTKLILLLIFLLTVLALVYSTQFKLDASSESLVLENDASLKYYREIRNKYGIDDFLIITYAPHSDLFSRESLEGIRYLRDNIEALDSVKDVFSILDAFIIYQSGVKLTELNNNIYSLEKENVDFERARLEFLTNPFYKDQLISADGKITALQVIFHEDVVFDELIEQRNKLYSVAELSAIQQGELQQIKQQIKEHNQTVLIKRKQEIELIRSIMDSERSRATLYLGGIPMITTDMIQYIRHDLIVFGAGVLMFIVLILFLFFRAMQWVFIPLITCTVTGIMVIGLLGYLEWYVTVISSNFLSILLIITLSLNIHLIVRYRDLQLKNPDMSHHDLIRETLSSMIKPCFYTIITTAVAFSSLIVSEIRPVIDFGWIMVIGLFLAFITSFLIFPCMLHFMHLPKARPVINFTPRVMLGIVELIKFIKPGKVIVLFLIATAFFAYGIPKLDVENRFIDNFKSTTEIYQGMLLIDQNLGGTTPLDIIIDADQEYFRVQSELEEEFSELDIFDTGTGSGSDQVGYWMTPTKLELLKVISDYLNSIPIIGKSSSINDTLIIAERLNQGELDAFEIALLHENIPDDIAADIVNPYLSEDSNQVRFSIRVKETDKSLNREQLLNQLRTFLVEEMHFEPEQVHLTGMLVLYNNMLQSLYRSQILTLGAVFIVIFITFILVFKSIKLALLGIVPNIFSTIFILGIMGWLDVPLDMMTITIASITIGIAVDDTIHYIYRFKHELNDQRDYVACIMRCHSGIGKAIYYTSLVIVFGFAILAMSNFIPTIYFGILTGLAMLIALSLNLILLPAMVMVIKPIIR